MRPAGDLHLARRLEYVTCVGAELVCHAPNRAAQRPRTDHFACFRECIAGTCPCARGVAGLCRRCMGSPEPSRRSTPGLGWLRAARWSLPRLGLQAPLHPAAREALLAGYDAGWADPTRFTGKDARPGCFMRPPAKRWPASWGARARGQLHRQRHGGRTPGRARKSARRGAETVSRSSHRRSSTPAFCTPPQTHEPTAAASPRCRWTRRPGRRRSASSLGPRHALWSASSRPIRRSAPSSALPNWRNARTRRQCRSTSTPPRASGRCRSTLSELGCRPAERERPQVRRACRRRPAGRT